MKVSCPSCDAKYTIADDKVVGKKIRVRCKTCSTQILVDGTLPQGMDASGDGEKAIAIAEVSSQPESSQPLNAAPESIESDSWTVNLSESEERTMTTKEIVGAAVHNQLGPDVFVWKEGMGDWALVTDVPELKAAIDSATQAAPGASKLALGKSAPLTKTPAGAKVAPRAGVAAGAKGAQTRESAKPPAAEETGERRGPIIAAPGSALAKKMASAKSASLAPKAEPVPEQPREIKPEPEKKAATRLATKRPHSTHDLFAAVDQAGSEIDVDTSEAEQPEHVKATGARNENSVLFSLDALKSGLGGAPKGAPFASGGGKRAPAPPAKRLEDLMTIDAAPPRMGGMSGMSGMSGMGGMGGGGLLLSGNDALLTAPAPPPPKPEPKPVPAAAIGAGGELYVPQRRSKLGLLIGVIAGIAVVGTAGAVVALKLSSHDVPPVASTDTSAKTATSTSAPALSASAAVAAAPSTTAVADAAVPSATASAAPVANVGKTGGSVTRAVGESRTSEKKPETKAEPAQAAVSGSFSKDAAVAQLSIAASQATVCKRPEGPWGTGQALVTFAPSGRVTTANVTGSPFGGTPVGGCVANVFRRARIPAFSGDAVTVSKRFTISP